MTAERYVDATSQKTVFEKTLDELERISQDTIQWDILRMTQKHFGDSAEDKASKLEAFLGGFIVNASVALYDRGLGEAAFAKLDQARKILEMKRKLETEVEAIRAKVDENAVDLSDVLGLFDEA